MCDQQSLRTACANAQSDQSICLSLDYSMSVKLLTEHHLEFLSLKGGCTGSCESTFAPQHEISNNVVCATSKASNQPAHTRSLIRAFSSCLYILWPLSYLEFLSLPRGCTGLSEFTLVKIPHCWKSHVTAHLSKCHIVGNHMSRLKSLTWAILGITREIRVRFEGITNAISAASARWRIVTLSGSISVGYSATTCFWAS